MASAVDENQSPPTHHEGPRKASDQLATPSLTPIVEQTGPSYFGNGNARRRSLESTNKSAQVPGPKAVRRTSSNTFDHATLKSTGPHSPVDPEKERTRRLPPAQLQDLAHASGSLPARALPSPSGKFPHDSPQHSDGLVSPVRQTLFTPPPDVFDSTTASGEESLPSAQPISPPPIPSAATNARPTHGSRSLTTPLFKRRESASAPRNPKATRETSQARDPSRQRRNSLTPLKIADDQHRHADALRSESPERGRTASPMPAILPLPPFSFPTYLQLELSTEKPSALYIHRSSLAEFPYESSKVKFERLLNFLRLPHQLEQVLWFGTLACLDAWLYTFTILPLRFLAALWLLLSWSATSLAKEASVLGRFVYAGSGRLWRRYTKGERPQPSRANSLASVTGDVDARQSRSRATNLDRTHETSKSKRKSSSVSRPRIARRRRMPSALSADHKADLLHGLLLILSSMILLRFDASRMYHSIRGQAAMKLYVIYNVLEVCDRLFSALGQDVLECLFSRETFERKANGRSKLIRPFWMFLLALVYTVVHATMLFYQVVTLNVAVNSYSNALLTLLLSNQFVEIKGTVFKKFEKENLFQLTCADVVERFQLWLMLSIIASRNMVEVGGLSLSAYTWPRTTALPPSSNTTNLPPNSTATPAGPSGATSLLPAAFSLLPRLNNPVLTPFLIVLGSEMLVDWIKHAYINKFNSVKPSIYGRFLDVLAKDYYGHAFLSGQNLTKRLGLPTLPLACLVLRAAAQVWGMFVATGSAPGGASETAYYVSKSLTADPAKRTATFDALRQMDTAVRRALGRSSFFGGAGPVTPDGPWWWRWWQWSADDLIASATALLFLLLLYLVLLAAKLVLGMALLRFARDRYKGMKEREADRYDAHARRVGGWGVVEVDEDKRRWIYDGDDEGLRKIRERDARAKEKRREGEGDAAPLAGKGGAVGVGGGAQGGDKGGLKLEGVGRYMMAAKRIW